MTIETIFGPEKKCQGSNAIRLKIIRPVYESVKIAEHVACYFDKTAPITSSARVAELFSFLRHETKEHFLALHLNAKNKLLCLEHVSVGSLSAAIVHPREVFKSAMLSSAAALIFLHNHPSGDSAPSGEDLELTKRLVQGGELLGIRILDHLIIGNGPAYSFADTGLI